MAGLRRCDVAAICALNGPEMANLLAIDNGWQELVGQQSSDPTVYYSADWVTAEGTTLYVIAASPSQMSALSSAALAAKVIVKYQPKIVAIIGIAAGARQAEQGFGDILAAEQTFDSASGKIVMGESGLYLQPDPNPLKVPARILNRLKSWSRQRQGLDKIRASWPGLKPDTALNLHVGPLASASAVLTSDESVAVIVQHWRKLIGVDVEAHGVHLACHESCDPPPVFLCLKSICNFLEGKNDNWRQYAAFTAMQALYHFLIDEWESLGLNAEYSNLEIRHDTESGPSRVVEKLYKLIPKILEIKYFDSCSLQTVLDRLAIYLSRALPEDREKFLQRAHSIRFKAAGPISEKLAERVWDSGKQELVGLVETVIDAVELES